MNSEPLDWEWSVGCAGMAFGIGVVFDARHSLGAGGTMRSTLLSSCIIKFSQLNRKANFVINKFEWFDGKFAEFAVNFLFV